MPALLPPETGESILGDAINADFDSTESLLQETGRTSKIVNVNDATQIVSSLTLALGIVFLVTTAILYGYYYSTTFDFTDLSVARSFSNSKGKYTVSTLFIKLYLVLCLLKDFKRTIKVQLEIRWPK